jgi:hypothetical protein
MARRPSVIPTVRLHTALPLDVRAKLDLFLYSEVEGKVPKDAISHFLAERIREFFEWKGMDLGPFIGELPGIHIIRGSPFTISKLEEVLKDGSDQDS